MKSLLMTTVLLSVAVSAAEVPPAESGPNPMQFKGQVFTLAADAPLKKSSLQRKLAIQH